MGGGKVVGIEAINGQDRLRGRPGLEQNLVVQHPRMVPEPQNHRPLALPLRIVITVVSIHGLVCNLYFVGIQGRYVERSCCFRH